MIWVYPPQMWYPEEDDVIESLDLGDAAYSSTMSTLAQVMVLAKDEFVLDVRADDADQARALAELAFPQVEGGGLKFKPKKKGQSVDWPFRMPFEGNSY